MICKHYMWVTAFLPTENNGKQDISTLPCLPRATSISITSLWDYETGRNTTLESLETASRRIIPCFFSKSIILSRVVSCNLLKDRLRHHPPAPLSTEASPPATVHPSRHVFATVQMPHPADFSHGFQTSPKQENRTWPRLFQTWVGSFNKKSWPKSITSIWHEPSRPPTSHVHHRWAAVWVLLVDLHEKNPFFFVGF